MKWISVDSVGPQVVEFTSPRTSSELEVESTMLESLFRTLELILIQLNYSGG